VSWLWELFLVQSNDGDPFYVFVMIIGMFLLPISLPLLLIKWLLKLVGLDIF